MSGSWDNTICLWYVHTGHLLQTITGNITDSDSDIGVRAIALNPDGRTLAVVTDEEVIRLWDVPTGKIKATLHADSVNAVVFSPDGTMLASGGSESLFVGCAHGETAENAKTCKGRCLWHRLQSRWTNSCKRELADDRIVGTVTAEHIGTFTGYPGWIEAVAFSPDGQTLASGNNGTVILWDMNQIPTQ